MRRVLLFVGVLACGFVGVNGTSRAEHPCAKGQEFSGNVVAGGQSDLFRLEGRSEKFALGGIYLAEPIQLSGTYKLFTPNSKTDRYGRLSVQAFQGDVWRQGGLLEKGQALVYDPPSTADCIDSMQKKEGLARQSKLGLWNSNAWPLLAQKIDELLKNSGHFVVVKGKVLSVGDRTNRIYLNFGQNWSHDFTVAVAKKGRGKFIGDIKPLLGLKGKTVQVRGILEEQQGPLLRLSNATQIEIID